MIHNVQIYLITIRIQENKALNEMLKEFLMFLISDEQQKRE